jgi:hypothetical protein
MAPAGVLQTWSVGRMTISATARRRGLVTMYSTASAHDVASEAAAVARTLAEARRNV